jgi:hypothetical protein
MVAMPRSTVPALSTPHSFLSGAQFCPPTTIAEGAMNVDQRATQLMRYDAQQDAFP